MGKLVALDVETTGLTWNDQLLGVGIAVQQDDGPITTAYYPVGHEDLFTSRSSIPETTLALDQALDEAEWVALHNASFDLPYLLRAQLLTEDQLTGRVFDTMVLARSTGPHDSVSLFNLAREFGLAGLVDSDWEMMKTKRKSLASLTVEETAKYCQQDALITAALCRKLQPLAYGQYGESWLRDDADFPLLVAIMRVRGQQLDMPWIDEQRRVGRQRSLEIVQQMLAEHNILGPNDRNGIVGFLRTQQVVPVRLTANKAISIEEDALSELKPQLQPKVRPVIDAIIECRHLEKVDSTWLSGLQVYADEQGRVHGGFTAGGTVSFRLSCDNPNMQAIPKEMQVLTHGPGYQALVGLDYSQAEYRIMAMYACEVAMAKLFNQPGGTDIHMATAVEMFGAEQAKTKRSYAKRANFAAAYGGGAQTIADAIGVSLESAKDLVQQHKRTFPRLYKTAKEAERAWKQRGYLELCTRRRLYGTDDDLERRPYKAFNQLIQGSVAETVKLAMLRMHRCGLRIVSQVHDEIKLEVPEGADLQKYVEQARTIMQEAVPERVQAMVNPRIAMLVDVSVISGGAHGGSD